MRAAGSTRNQRCNRNLLQGTPEKLGSAGGVRPAFLEPGGGNDIICGLLTRYFLICLIKDSARTPTGAL